MSVKATKVLACVFGCIEIVLLACVSILAILGRLDGYGKTAFIAPIVNGLLAVVFAVILNAKEQKDKKNVIGIYEYCQPITTEGISEKERESFYLLCFSALERGELIRSVHFGYIFEPEELLKYYNIENHPEFPGYHRMYAVIRPQELIDESRKEIKGHIKKIKELEMYKDGR